MWKWGGGGIWVGSSLRGKLSALFRIHCSFQRAKGSRSEVRVQELRMSDACLSFAETPAMNGEIPSVPITTLAGVASLTDRKYQFCTFTADSNF